MCKRISSLLLAFTLSAMAADKSPAPADSGASQKFAALIQRYFDQSAVLYPINATELGNHRYDDQMDDVSHSGREQRRLLHLAFLNDLKALPYDRLSRDDKVDYALLEHHLRANLWRHDTLQEWAWNPLIYTRLTGGAIYGLMARDFAPLTNRLQLVTARLEKYPKLFEQIRGALDPNRVSKIHAETAAAQNQGFLNIVTNMVLPYLKFLPEHDSWRLTQAIKGAQRASTAHQRWLEKELLPQARAAFRLGPKLYDEKLAWTLGTSLTRQQIREQTEQQLRVLHGQMYQISRKVYGQRYPLTAFPEKPSSAYQRAIIRSCLEIAYQNRPGPDEVASAIQHSLKLTRDFIRQKNLITLPDDPLNVIVMPEFERGVSLAYCDSPGPFEAGQKTFYAVAPPPKDWTPNQVDSHLREYNVRSLHNLTIHEAMPGHYVQLAHANRNPRKIRAVLSSGVFVEGWAVYAEWMMVENGFLAHDPLMALIVLKWYLRDATNALLDQAVHVDGISRDAALKLLMEDAFQEESEAVGKYRRAQLTSAQLSTYFVGYVEHVALRRTAEERLGDKFDLKTYHDTALSFGSIPTQYVRALMFGEEIGK